MFKLAQALKGHREAGSLNEQINLFGFVDDHTFLTKSGDVGVVLAVKGVDYECLACSEIDNYTKRLESAFKILDDKCRIYQYLFKGSNPAIPSKSHENPVVNAAIESRIEYLKSKAQSLYGLTIYFVVLLESPPAKRTVSRILTTGNSDLKRSMSELKALLSTEKQVALVGDEIRAAQAVLAQKVSSFILQVNDFLPVELLDKQQAFRFLKQILNFAPHKLEAARLKHDTFLDYYLCESHVECHRGFLRVDDYYARV